MSIKILPESNPDDSAKTTVNHTPTQVRSKLYRQLLYSGNKNLSGAICTHTKKMKIWNTGVTRKFYSYSPPGYRNQVYLTFLIIFKQ